MGATVWFFIRRGEGEFRAATLRAMDDFFDGRHAFPEAAAQAYIEYAELHVELTDRRPTDVYRVGFFKYRVDARGRIHGGEHRQRAELAGEMLDIPLPEADQPPEVLDGRSKFAARKFDRIGRWKPSERDLDALRSAVNKRARRDLL
jgi:hypothetical protein